MVRYRTAYGSHSHQSYECANQRRAIASGDPTEIPADEIADWTPCEHCCPAYEVAASLTTQKAKIDAQCPNSGVRNPKCIQSECRDCGKRGTVNRSTGSLRAHKPQK